MSNARPPYDDEIDFTELLLFFWDGKWKILAFVLISVIFVFGYQSYQPVSFDLTTKVKPISSIENDIYTQSNDFNFFIITRKILFNLYVEKLQQTSLWEDAIRENGMIKDIDDEIIKFASSVKILPLKKKEVEEVEELEWLVEVKIKSSNFNRWKQVLNSVNSAANQSVKNTLKQRFENSVYINEVKLKMELEDTEEKIENALNDYDKMTSQRLSFLKEQAVIARKLNIAKNVSQTQISDNKGVLSLVNTSIPENPKFNYLRGYEAIETEILLTENRNNKEEFVDGLLELQQKKRETEQDKKVERAKIFFSQTPIMTNESFVAAKMEVFTTDIKQDPSKRKNMLTLVLAILLGGIIGTIYLVISNAKKKLKE